MDMFLNLALGIDKGHLKRGQFEASLSDLAERWKWNKMKVHRFLTKLSKNEISWVLPGSLRGSLHLPSTITIKKYNELNPLSLPEVLPEVVPGSLPSERKEKGNEREMKGKEDLCVPKTLLGIFEEENQRLPEVKIFSSGRESKCRSRINRAKQDGRLEQYLEDFRQAVKKAQLVPFLRGEGSDGWRASFDWFIANEENVYKVLEGRYEGKQRPKEQTPEEHLADVERRVEEGQRLRK